MSTPTPTPEVQPADATAALPADLQDERLIASQGVGGFVRAFVSRLRSGDLGSLPVVVGLVVIWGVFAFQNDAFLSSRNLVNLTQQSVSTGIIALGIVLVLLLGEIDLSVGSISGLSAAILAVGFVSNGWSLPLTILIALLSGAVIGALYGLLYTRFGVPSFVITLAGLLGFLGLQIKVLGKEGSINIPFDSAIVEFSQDKFLSDAVSYTVVLAAVLIYVATRLRANQRRTASGLSTTPVVTIAVRSVALLLLLGIPAYVLNRDRGVSYMFVLFLALVVVFDFVIRRTRWGRSVLAIGGNVEAARRAGINVKRVYVTVFVFCSTLAALGGLLAAGRLAAANQSSGGGDINLNAIASAVIGGTSLFGGRGSAYSALLGILVIQSISNGLSLVNLGSPERYMITGGVLLLAVIVDSLSRRSRAAHGRA
jgi:D-xylose transport system permease protein